MVMKEEITLKYVLDDEDFDLFQKQLDDNPISQNKALKELLSREKQFDKPSEEG